jgi:hypothetical protein
MKVVGIFAVMRNEFLNRQDLALARHIRLTYNQNDVDAYHDTSKD